jgi:hypothetical protein
MNDAARAEPHPPSPIRFHVGHEELVIRKRYEMLSVANDLLIGVWFLVGSFFFLSPTLTRTGTWLFVLGSVEMLVRPAIRFARGLHLRRFDPDARVVGPGSQDF